MGLRMFWWSNGVKLQNLSLIYEILIGKKNRHSKYWKPPHSYHIVPFLTQKSSLQYFIFHYWNSLDRYPIVIFVIWLLSREFQYLKWWIFSHGSSLLCIWGLSSAAQVIWSLLSTCTENWLLGQKRDNMVAVGRFSILRVPIFFPQIIIIS